MQRTDGLPATGPMQDRPPAEGPAPRHRTVFLSDLHLGAFGSRADLILRFLTENPAETYVLVGDILDLWHPILPAWGPDHQRVIDHLAARHAAGAGIRYVRGNHDPLPDTAPAARRLPVQAVTEAVHHGADGRRYLVIHGDAQDPRILQSLILRRIGSKLDEALRRLDRRLRRLRDQEKAARRPSLIGRLIAGFNAVACTGRGNERRLVALARGAGLDGVICGHFHIPALHRDHGLTYVNCGDWVDNMTAVTEDFSGALRLVSACPIRARAAGPAPAIELGALGT